MIISFFNRNQPGVKGTINTDGEAPTATGVGEPMLKAWMEMHADEDPQSAVEGLEAFYSSWANQGGYSTVEPSGNTDGQLSIIQSDPPRLILTTREDVQVREDGEWRSATEDESFSGKRVKVTDAAVNAWDAGEITAETDLSQYQSSGQKPAEPEEKEEE